VKSSLTVIGYPNLAANASNAQALWIQTRRPAQNRAHPRPLLPAVRCGLDEPAIAAQHDVTTKMARFRVNRTGVGRQVAEPGSIATSVRDARLMLPVR
jgi:hypothetical protein